jgi:hypothetical protein
MFNKMRRISAILVAIVFLAAWFTEGALDNVYVEYPREADQKSGAIVPYAVKGVVVYITKSQKTLLSALRWVELGTVAVMIIMVVVYRGDPLKKK